MTQVTGKWLSEPATQAVFAMLGDAGHQVYAVGGCVRNALMRMPIADVDFATSATPHQVSELAKTCGFGCVPTGIAHGTVTIVVRRESFEVTTFRKDLQTDGRHATIGFANTVEEDARRRDFTMNALYSDAAGNVTDPLGGMVDVISRHVRFIDDPDARIREDYLRILRFFRFFAWYNDQSLGIDAEALAACAKNIEGLDSLPKERIGMEMHKLLLAVDPAPAIAAMASTGILARLLPGAGLNSLAVLIHLEAQIGAAPNAIRRLAMVGGQDAAGNLRLSRADARDLILLQRLMPEDQSLSEIAYRYGQDVAVNVGILLAASTQSALPARMLESTRKASEQVFPVKSVDISANFQGRALGEELARLETKWIASGFLMTKQQLLA